MKKLILAAALGLSSVGAYASTISIDDFSDPAHNAVDTSTNPGVTVCSAGSADGSGCFSSVLNANILGGERDIFADLVSRDFGMNDVEMAVAAGVLSFNVGSGSRGTGTITYDGIDGSNAVNTTGLGGADLTYAGQSTGFVFDVLHSDAGFHFDINVWDAMGVLTTANFVSTGTNTPIARTISYADAAFAGFDFTNVGALQFVIDPAAGFTALDLSLDNIKTVSEPAPLLLMSVGLLGLGLVRRKRNKA